MPFHHMLPIKYHSLPLFNTFWPFICSFHEFLKRISFFRVIIETQIVYSYYSISINNRMSSVQITVFPEGRESIRYLIISSNVKNVSTNSIYMLMLS
ncbi:hypothetical protein RIR_jg29032.t1 [Rhizophagus irregularis DAOM 181602=DAOM 197198]|nr:hypothetical protein RIR_jg29032.t1 [Rhizophagus irregularis DAOM 181602=DAOM 197198]